jgi:hypothetical protein
MLSDTNARIVDIPATKSATKRSSRNVYPSQILGYVVSANFYAISRLIFLKDGDEEKINHRIPHRFEPLTNIGANWCCHCGYMLPLGRKNARKCTECDITCHANCAHLVPDFCGMSMETANELLRSWRDINKARSDKQRVGPNMQKPLQTSPLPIPDQAINQQLGPAMDRMKIASPEQGFPEGYGRPAPPPDRFSHDGRYQQQSSSPQIPPMPLGEPYPPSQHQQSPQIVNRPLPPRQGIAPSGFPTPQVAPPVRPPSRPYEQQLPPDPYAQQHYPVSFFFSTRILANKLYAASSGPTQSTTSDVSTTTTKRPTTCIASNIGLSKCPTTAEATTTTSPSKT